MKNNLTYSHILCSTVTRNLYKAWNSLFSSSYLGQSDTSDSLCSQGVAIIVIHTLWLLSVIQVRIHYTALESSANHTVTEGKFEAF